MAGNGVAAGFGEWDRHAMVRTATRHELDPAEQGSTYFPWRVMPHAGHPLVESLDPAARERLAIDYLYQYLLFTMHLEVEIVNDVVGRLAMEEGDHEPPWVRAEALKIYCDESYHAVASLDLLNQIAEHTGVPVPSIDFERIGDRVKGAARHHVPDDPRLAGLLPVIVFETVVTSILSDIPRDPTVFTVIRNVVDDHARDERRHHAFFMRCLTAMWPRLSDPEQRMVAAAVPDLIHACLCWDEEPVRRSLAGVGLTPAEVETVIADRKHPDRVAAQLRRSARYLIRRCVDLGMTELPEGAVAFARRGLILADGQVE
jgi:hypothetical protein